MRGFYEKNKIFSDVQIDTSRDLLINIYLYFQDGKIKEFENKEGMKIKSSFINVYKKDIYDCMHFEIYGFNDFSFSSYPIEDFSDLDYLIKEIKEIVNSLFDIKINYAILEEQRKQLAEELDLLIELFKENK